MGLIQIQVKDLARLVEVADNFAAIYDLSFSQEQALKKAEELLMEHHKRDKTERTAVEEATNSNPLFGIWG